MNLLKGPQSGATRAWRIVSRRPVARSSRSCRHISSQAPISADVDQPASSMPSPQEVAKARQYCLDLLRRADTPSSLLLPYIPRAARDAYIALRAFNVDVARTADTTATPTIARMRLQFQRDAVTKSLAGAPPRQPIAQLLAAAAHDLARRSGSSGRTAAAVWHARWFVRAIDAREQALAGAPYPSLAALETYAEHTYGSLMYLTLAALPLASLTADHVASHIGKAVGIAAVLRGLPLLAFPPRPGAHSNQAGFAGGASDVGAAGATVALPLDVMAAAGVREEEVLRRGAAATGLRDAVFAVATRASDHLITARQMLANVREGRDAGHEFEHLDDYEHAERVAASPAARETPAQEVERAFGVFMPAVATQLWLDLLQKHDFDVFAPQLRVTDWRLPFKAFVAWNRRKI